MMMEKNKIVIAVVIPAYKVRNHIVSIIDQIDSRINQIYVVDDECPEESGKFVAENCKDQRVVVLKNSKNLGVGGAVIRGMNDALKNGADIIVKLDGDGQHDPRLIKSLIKPILAQQADYTKGNRFISPETIKAMPIIRLLGNIFLSFFAKLSTGYWNLFDPTNGFVAIHAKVLRQIPLSKLSKGYFFETDMMFRLYVVRAKVIQIPMNAIYGEESSGLNPSKMIWPFFINHLKCFLKRIIYFYFMWNFSLASLFLTFGILFSFSGIIIGCATWIFFSNIEMSAPTGSVMLPTLLIILGFQMILGFLTADMGSVPDKTIYPMLDLYELNTDYEEVDPL
jgi:dolichol-phosphate mannosyltransferase